MACRLEILNKGGKIKKKREKEEEKEETIRKIRTNIVEINPTDLFTFSQLFLVSSVALKQRKA